MDEVKEKKFVTQDDFKNELKSMRLDFKEAIIDLNQGIQGQIQALQDKMEPLAHLNSTIFKNMLGMTFVLGGALFWLIDRDFDKIQLSINQYNEQNQARLARLEEISLTPSHQILLTKVGEFLDAYNKSERETKAFGESSKSKKTKTRTKR